MSCFLATDVNNNKFPKLSYKVSELKNPRGEVNPMCELMEKYMKESKLEGKIEGKIEATIQSLRLVNMDDSVIIKALMENCGLTKDEAKQKLAGYNN